MRTFSRNLGLAALLILACCAFQGIGGKGGDGGKAGFGGGASGGGTPTFIQAAQNHYTSVTSTIQVGNGVGSGWAVGNVGTGHTLVVVGNYSGSTTFTATDTLSTSFACIAATSGLTAGNFFVCVGKTTTSGADEITVTSGANIDAYLTAFEFSNVATGSLDQHASGNVAACTSCTLASITTLQGTGVTFGCGGTDAANATFTAGSSYTLPTNGTISASGQAIGCEYLITSSTGTQTPTINIASSTAISGLTFNVY
jgi:hypothetical protein